MLGTLDSGAVSRSQRYGLADWLLLACFLLASLRSFASPCEPSGRGSIVTTIMGAYCGLYTRAVFDRSQSNPNDDMSLAKISAAFPYVLSPEAATRMPRCNGPFVPSFTGPSRILITGSGSVGFQDAGKEAAKSLPKSKASMSLLLYWNHARLMVNDLSCDLS